MITRNGWVSDACHGHGNGYQEDSKEFQEKCAQYMADFESEEKEKCERDFLLII